jgi:hypothetical protein
MPLMPNFLERMLFFGLNQGPGPMLDIWSLIGFRTILAGVRLGVFENLDKGEKTQEVLAEQLNLDPRGTMILLETLVSIGYLEKHRNDYSLTTMARKWMVRSSGMDLSPGFRYWAAVMPLFDQLEESLRSGSPPVNMYDWLESQEQVTQDFQDYMVPLAKFALPEVSRRLRLPSSTKHILDIGGGHAMFSIALCKLHPQLNATVFDTTAALNAGVSNISQAGLSNRIQVREGNFLSDDLGSGYDAALLFNIIHGLSPEHNTDLLRKVTNALNAGGMAVVLEQFGTEMRLPMSRAGNNILGLSYYHLLGGQVYSYEQVEGWYAAAGYIDINRIQLRSVPGNSLVMGKFAGK